MSSTPGLGESGSDPGWAGPKARRQGTPDPHARTSDGAEEGFAAWIRRELRKKSSTSSMIANDINAELSQKPVQFRT